MDDISKKDLNHILYHSESCWKELAGARIFFTGGTGLFGIWFLEAMEWAQKQLNLKFEVVVLSRNPELFLKSHPKFKVFSFLSFHMGDITSFKAPSGAFSHVLHGAATSAQETFQNEDASKKFNTIAEGTRQVLEFAEIAKVVSMLFTSSGVAYGKQPEGMPLMREDYSGIPEAMSSQTALGLGKKEAESLCAVYGKKTIHQMKIARCFSFVGPCLPLNIHYAIGNFIEDGLKNRPIHIRGDGKAVRSYLYMADLVIWLITIWIKGQSLRLYNVGSEEARSIAEVAKTVAKVFNNKVPVSFAEKTLPPPEASASNLYVPSTKRAREELGLKQWIGFEESVRRTVEFYQGRVS